MSGTLFVVATPIGNLDDLAPRARKTLEAVDLIAAEDTRRTGRLLSHFGIETRLLSLHEYNEDALAATLIDRLLDGTSIALVSDAGTPLLSDPGYRLVAAAREAGIAVSPIPGPSGVTAALSVAGLPTDRFCFEGFLPAKAKARLDALRGLAHEPRTMVFFESVHRCGDTLAALAEVFGADRPAFLARELTKLHEQCLRAPLGDLAEQFRTGMIPPKGEFVIVVGGSSDTRLTSSAVDRLLIELADKLPPKDVARSVARATGEKRNALYLRLLELGKGDA